MYALLHVKCQSACCFVEAGRLQGMPSGTQSRPAGSGARAPVHFVAFKQAQQHYAYAQLRAKGGGEQSDGARPQGVARVRERGVAAAGARG